MPFPWNKKKDSETKKGVDLATQREALLKQAIDKQGQIDKIAAELQVSSGSKFLTGSISTTNSKLAANNEAKATQKAVSKLQKELVKMQKDLDNHLETDPVVKKGFVKYLVKLNERKSIHQTKLKEANLVQKELFRILKVSVDAGALTNFVIDNEVLREKIAKVDLNRSHYDTTVADSFAEIQMNSLIMAFKNSSEVLFAILGEINSSSKNPTIKELKDLNFALKDLADFIQDLKFYADNFIKNIDNSRSVRSNQYTEFFDAAKASAIAAKPVIAKIVPTLNAMLKQVEQKLAEKEKNDFENAKRTAELATQEMLSRPRTYSDPERYTKSTSSMNTRREQISALASHDSRVSRTLKVLHSPKLQKLLEKAGMIKEPITPEQRREIIKKLSAEPHPRKFSDEHDAPKAKGPKGYKA